MSHQNSLEAQRSGSARSRLSTARQSTHPDRTIPSGEAGAVRYDPFNRRSFIKAAVTLAALAALRTRATPSPEPAVPAGRLIDANVYLSHWPLRRVRYDDTADLVAMLRSRNVVQAWTGSFDALLHKDIASANARLAGECHRHGRGLLVPFGSINPKAPDWEQTWPPALDRTKCPASGCTQITMVTS